MCHHPRRNVVRSGCFPAFLHFTFCSALCVQAALIVNYAGSEWFLDVENTVCLVEPRQIRAYRHKEVIHRINKLGHIATRALVSESLHLDSVTGWSADEILHVSTFEDVSSIAEIFDWLYR